MVPSPDMRVTKDRLAARQIYLYDISSGYKRNDVGDPRPARRQASNRLRDQADRRPVDAVLLGCELRPDLSGAAAPRGGGARRGKERPDGQARTACLLADREGPRGAAAVAPRDRDADGDARRVAAAHLLRRRAAARGGAQPSARARDGVRRGARRAPAIDERPGEDPPF